MYARFALRPSTRLPRWLFVTCAVLLLALLGVGLWFRFGPQPIGTAINPPRVMPDFELRGLW